MDFVLLIIINKYITGTSLSCSETNFNLLIWSSVFYNMVSQTKVRVLVPELVRGKSTKSILQNWKRYHLNFTLWHYLKLKRMSLRWIMDLLIGTFDWYILSYFMFWWIMFFQKFHTCYSIHNTKVFGRKKIFPYLWSIRERRYNIIVFTFGQFNVWKWNSESTSWFDEWYKLTLWEPNIRFKRIVKKIEF